MKRKSTDHIRIANMPDGRYEMICENCKINTILTPPMPLDEFLRLTKQYATQHKNCKPREEL